MPSSAAIAITHSRSGSQIVRVDPDFIVTTDQSRSRRQISCAIF